MPFSPHARPKCRTLIVTKLTVDSI